MADFLLTPKPEPVIMQSTTEGHESERLRACVDPNLMTPGELAEYEATPRNHREIVEWEQQNAEQQRLVEESRDVSGGAYPPDYDALQGACDASGLSAIECDEEYRNSGGDPDLARAMNAAYGDDRPSVGPDPGGKPLGPREDKGKRIIRDLNALRAPINERGIQAKHRFVNEHMAPAE